MLTEVRSKPENLSLTESTISNTRHARVAVSRNAHLRQLSASYKKPVALVAAAEFQKRCIGIGFLIAAVILAICYCLNIPSAHMKLHNHGQHSIVSNHATTRRSRGAARQRGISQSHQTLLADSASPSRQSTGELDPDNLASPHRGLLSRIEMTAAETEQKEADASSQIENSQHSSTSAADHTVPTDHTISTDHINESPLSTPVSTRIAAAAAPGAPAEHAQSLNRQSSPAVDQENKVSAMVADRNLRVLLQQFENSQTISVEQTTRKGTVPDAGNGAVLSSPNLSTNAVTLAEQLRVLAPLRNLNKLKANVTEDNVAARIEILNQRKSISETLRNAEMDVNFVLAEIHDEQSLYQELLGAYSQERDSAIARTNMASFGANGVLWSVTEALSIPCYRHPVFAAPAGIVGIVAGIVPSLASAYVFRQVGGKKHSAPAAPNMLAKLFDRAITNHVEYPDAVWNFLDSHPSDDQKHSRRDLIIEKWIKDAQIPVLTHWKAKDRVDTLTACTEQKKTITIAVLSARLIMLSRLSAEVSKMNRQLNELEMALRGTKQA